MPCATAVRVRVPRTSTTPHNPAPAQPRTSTNRAAMQQALHTAYDQQQAYGQQQQVAVVYAQPGQYSNSGSTHHMHVHARPGPGPHRSST